MFNEDGIKIGSKYTISYNGYLFYGDNDGLNFHDYENWNDVQFIINAYGYEPSLELEVKDNEYQVVWKNGEWY